MFFPTYKTPNKGFLGVLHDGDSRWGPPETTPHSPKVKKGEKCTLGVRIKKLKFVGVGKFFVCDRDFFHFFFGSSEKTAA